MSRLNLRCTCKIATPLVATVYWMRLFIFFFLCVQQNVHRIRSVHLSGSTKMKRIQFISIQYTFHSTENESHTHKQAICHYQMCIAHTIWFRSPYFIIMESILYTASDKSKPFIHILANVFVTIIFQRSFDLPLLMFSSQPLFVDTRFSHFLK